MSNAWLVEETDAEDLLDFLFSDSRFHVSSERENGERVILITVEGKEYRVGTFNYKKSKCTLSAMSGGPSPWRSLVVVDCPVGMPIKRKCPVCCGTEKHLRVGVHHPIFKYLEKNDG